VPWVVSFVVAWLLFLALVRWPLLRYTAWGGLAAALVQVANDALMIRQGLYRIEQPLAPFLHSSAFFSLGPPLALGVLFIQYLPRAPWLQALNVAVWAALFLGLETLLCQSGVLVYQHWNPALSYFVDILVMGFLTWLLQGAAARARAAGGGRR